MSDLIKKQNMLINTQTSLVKKDIFGTFPTTGVLDDFRNKAIVIRFQELIVDNILG